MVDVDRLARSDDSGDPDQAWSHNSAGTSFFFVVEELGADVRCCQVANKI